MHATTSVPNRHIPQTYFKAAPTLTVLTWLLFQTTIQAAAPVSETVPMNGRGDVADDVAIWLHPADHSKSVLLGTNKSAGAAGGLYAFDLKGRKYGSTKWGASNWFAQGKAVNEVDVRCSAFLNGRRRDIVAVANRTDQRVDLFCACCSPDGTFAGLIEIGSVCTKGLGGDNPYGTALFYSRNLGKLFLIASSKNGHVAQWQLNFDAGAEQIAACQVWSADPAPRVRSEVEGIVADDQREVVYVAAENVAIYRYETDRGIIQNTGRVTVDTVHKRGGRLTADIEGLAIYRAAGGEGYLLASSQGSDAFHVYLRTFTPGKANAHLGAFTVTGVSATDGIGVISADLGDNFTAGLFVAHDARGDDPSNYKLTAWHAISNEFDPPLLVDAAAMPTLADAAVTVLNPFPISANTGEKPQSKLWMHDGHWWSVMPDSSGTWVRRLSVDTWQPVLLLTKRTAVKADVVTDDRLAHVLLFDGADSQLVSLEYAAGSGDYEFWSERSTPTSIALPGNAETATIALDTSGRLWVAADNKAAAEIQVCYSDRNYRAFSDPMTIGSNIGPDDIGAVTALPGGSIGVLWSNQNVQRFHFREHPDGADPATWSSTQTAAGQSALPIGGGMADDHINCAVTSDGTLYAAVKTEHDTPGYTKIGLLVRRPSGQWDDLYPVDDAGTRPIVLLDESAGRLMVTYTTSERAGDIVFRESALDDIQFSKRRTLMSGRFNNVTSTKQIFHGEIVLMASGAGQAFSVKVSTHPAPEPSAVPPGDRGM